MKRPIFIGIIVAVFGVYSFGLSLNYSIVMNSEVKAATYFLSNQSTNGAFQIPPYIKKIPHMRDSQVRPWMHVPEFSPITEFLLGETANVLHVLYKLGLPTDTNGFVKAVNFVTQSSTYTTISGVPLIGDPQAQMLSDFLFIQGVFGIQLSKCARLARNIIVDNYLSYSYEPLKYVTELEMPPYAEYQKLELRYFALKIINILPFVRTRKLIDLFATNSKKKTQTDNKQIQIANTLTSMYVVLKKYLMNSYTGNGKWLPKILNPHGGIVGVSIESLYFLSKLNNVIFNILGRKLNVKGEIFKDMSEYGIEKLKDTEAVKETVKYIISSQASDGSWGGVTKPLPPPVAIKGIKTKIRFYSEPGLGRIFITSEAITALLRMGVPATSISIKKAVEFLVNRQSKSGYWKSNFYEWSDVTTVAMLALREYAKYRWNKEINISKELPLSYLKKRKVNVSELSQKLGILYLGMLNRLVDAEISRIN